QDPETISLAAFAAPASAAVVRCDPAGRMSAEFAQAGHYELQRASGRTQEFDIASLPAAQELAGPWELRFPPHWGAPDRITLETLVSWSHHPDPGVKFFSGLATYRKTFDLSESPAGSAGRRVYLDLGNVQVMARVTLNGRDLGVLWKPPYRLDITRAARRGSNTLEMAVANLWPNRMIGDEELPEDSQRNPNGTLKEWPAWVQAGKPSPTGRYTFTTWNLWKKDDPPVDSGLLGPVTLHWTQTARVRH
ncbi:MAG: glycosyl hydrolase family 43, partial [Verrucomicrobia bacterium]|nr:glycosyl hydrolase family 43 [Verrucomicrobiota bacterium]